VYRFLVGCRQLFQETNQSGFEEHVANDHNIWDYLSFIIHIQDMDPFDYTPAEKYVLGIPFLAEGGSVPASLLFSFILISCLWRCLCWHVGRYVADRLRERTDPSSQVRWYEFFPQRQVCWSSAASGDAASAD
jgi:hypothetical protein